ncbi:MAG: SAM-dependent methyltransferase [Opitutaceae bacterium]
MEPLTSPHPVSGTFARRFTDRCDELCAAAPAGEAKADRATLPFADFMQLALYDPETGYYTSARGRVGRGPGTDFYTASNMKRVFGPLVAASAANLLGTARASEHVFVEIGAEPGPAVLDGVPHPFGEFRTVRIGERIEIPPRAVVFSNELFDAQPFSRVIFRAGRWREMGVRLSDDRLEWSELDRPSPEVEAISDRLPRETLEGYVIDLPLRADALMREIAGQPWSGLLLAFDYGRTWEILRREHPRGTGRGYREHRHTESLLDSPGEQDLTCHVCWDWLETALRDGGFSDPRRAGQESFFVQHAAEAIGAIVAADPSPLSAARSQLKQLIHPALMGQRFEALWAVR